METSATSNYTTSSAQNAPTTVGFDDLKGEDFLTLMIAELQSQDPLNPTDNQQLLAQLASVREMQQSETLNETLKTLAAEQRFGSTGALIGQYVAGTVEDGEGNQYNIQGLVIGVAYEPDGDAILQLHNGRELPATKVEEMTLVENLPEDILEQLQQDLGVEEEEEEEEEDDDTTARTIKADATGMNATANKVRVATARADIVASLMESLASPGARTSL